MGERYADEVDSLLAPWLMARTKEEIFEVCRRHRIPFTPVRDIWEVVNEAHLKARGFFVEMERAEMGRLRYPGAPYKLSETPWRLARPAPRLGEHNEEVLCGRLGYSREEMAALRRTGVI